MRDETLLKDITEDESRPGWPSTVARFGARELRVELRITGPKHKRERRAIILGMIQEIERWVGFLHNGHIVHKDSHWQTRLLALDRGITLAQAVRIDTEAQKIGTEIRMLRLRSGRSQENLAEASRLTRSHLSDIERGKCFPKEETLRAIYEALEVPYPDS